MNPYLEIIRPTNGIMAAVAVAVGYMIASHGLVFTPVLAYAMLSAFLILSAGMAINDYYDFSIDLQRKQHRPLPSGRMRRSVARYYAALLFGAGLVLAWLSGMAAFAVALAAAVILFLYAAHFAAKPFTGNLLVAVCTALTFVFGAAAAGEAVSVQIIALAGMAMFATLAREIYKSIEDLRADKGVRETLPMRIGVNRAALIAAFALVVAVMLSPAPYWAGAFGERYLLLISLVDAGFLYTALGSMKSKDFAREAKYCKIFQAAALIAFLAGAF
jgi:geranylgeranylglycerol-phosphate geranylgeranyltransferase